MSLKACTQTAVFIAHLSLLCHDLKSIYFHDSALLYTLGLIIITNNKRYMLNVSELYGGKSIPILFPSPLIDECTILKRNSWRRPRSCSLHFFSFSIHLTQLKIHFEDTDSYKQGCNYNVEKFLFFLQIETKEQKILHMWYCSSQVIQQETEVIPRWFK